MIKKTKQSHTPTPWKKSESKNSCDWRIHQENGVMIGILGRSTFTENEANASFIIRAVNSHEELLEALKEVVRYMKNETDNPSAVYDRVKQAIANAEKE